MQITTDKYKKPYSEVLIKLYQGAVYSKDNAKHWDLIINYQDQIRDHLGTIGLELVISELDMYAFIRHKLHGEGEETQLPPLIEKRKLSYRATVLSVLLAEKLWELDAAAGDTTKLVMQREEIRDLVKMFLPDQKNEANMLDRFDESIAKLTSYGYLRKIDQKGKEDKYEVMRILKAKVPAESLLKIKEKLQSYGGKSSTI